MWSVVLTLVVVLVTAAIIGAFVHRATAAYQPATERRQNHRGDPPDQATTATEPDAQRRPPDQGTATEPDAEHGVAATSASKPTAAARREAAEGAPRRSRPRRPNVVVRLVRRFRAWRADLRARPFPPWWRRVVALLQLLVLVLLVGVAAAAIVGAIVLLVVTVLGAAID